MHFYRMFIVSIIIMIVFISSSCSPSGKNKSSKAEKTNSGVSHTSAKVSGNKTAPDDSGDLKKAADLLRHSRLREAGVLLDEIIKKEPDNAKAFFYRGILFQKQVEFEKSLADYNKSISLNPGFAKVYGYKGRLLIVKNGSLKEAQECFDEALKLDPDCREAQMGVGMIFMFREEYAAARDFFNKLMGTITDIDNPDNADLFQERGFANYYVGDSKKALDDFEKSIELDPFNFFVTYNYAGKAMAYFRLEDPDNAVAELDKIKNNEEIVSLHSEYDPIVQLIYYQGNTEKAFDVSRLAHQAFPGLYPDVRRYAEMLDLMGKTAESHKHYQQAVKMNPRTSEPYERMGYSWMVLGESEKAEEMFLKGIESSEDDSEIGENMLQYAGFLYRTGRYAKAGNMLNTVIKTGNKIDRKILKLAYLMMCEMKLITGKPEEAKEAFRQAERIDPSDPNNAPYKADLMINTGRKGEALAILKKITAGRYRLLDDAYDIELKMAEALFASGNKKDGLKYLKSVFEKDYPAAGLYRLRYVIPQSRTFRKTLKDPQVAEYLKTQKLRIFDIYRKGGRTPQEI